VRPVDSTPATGTFRRALRELLRRKRSRFAALLVSVFVILSVFADLLASDRPIVCHVRGSTYVLPCVTHPDALAAWDNQKIEIETHKAGFTIAPLVAFGPSQETGAIAMAPFASAGHPLGTDAHGRDVFARLIHGARTALGVGVFAVAGIVAIGALLGALAGYFGRRIDAIVARVIDVLSSFPALVLLVVVQALQPHPTIAGLLLAIGLTRWPEVARLVRAEVLVVASRDYTVAARALGATPMRVLFRHVLPNARGPIFVAAALGLGQLVVLEASLSFLRVGVPPPSASWGEMLSEVRDGPTAWWLVILPGALLVGLALALHVVGESLRDGFDPHHSASR
jgi:peptide/nickel transport system permease protein